MSVLVAHGLFTLPDIYLQQKAEIKVCVFNVADGVGSICSKGTITKLLVISMKVQETGQMNAELWYVDKQAGKRPFRNKWR